MANDLVEPYYIDPLLGGRAFFESCSVSADGVLLDRSPGGMDRIEHLYQASNRILCTDGLRKETYGSSMARISSTAERDYSAKVEFEESAAAVTNAAGQVTTPAKPYVMPAEKYVHPSLKSAFEFCTHDSKTTTTPITARLGFDGQWPFSSQNNSLRALTGQKIDNGFLHPGAELSITLLKREPLFASVERADVTDENYFAGTVPARANQKPEIKIEVQILSISMEYESVTLKQSELDKFRSATQKYYWDLVTCRQNNLASKNLTNSFDVVVPPGTMLVVLAWVTQWQTIHGAKERTWLSTRFRFPPNLKRLSLSHSGVDGVLQAAGFEELGTEKCNNSHSLRALHADMIRKKLYSKPFDTWVPPRRPTKMGHTNLGYDQLIPYPCQEHTGQNTTTLLTVNHQFEGAGVPDGWVMLSLCIGQGVLEYSVANKWQRKG